MVSLDAQVKHQKAPALRVKVLLSGHRLLRGVSRLYTLC